MSAEKFKFKGEVYETDGTSNGTKRLIHTIKKGTVSTSAAGNTDISFSESGGEVTVNMNVKPYEHPTTAGNKHIPDNGATGNVLGYGGSAGTAAWQPVSMEAGALKIGNSTVATIFSVGSTQPPSACIWFNSLQTEANCSHDTIADPVENEEEEEEEPGGGE